ncbi:sensor histidine kinase [Flavobacterium aurantiibacter]|uniref:histidine kinase n=1 Tax=Flavobacterium aurantiibacter TaxID=2023067 RepID=A0A255ZSK9_9FLAO|nr:sensor histidine kinase [Flavobacterium aurantiibacter]OYQ43710.1 hypothetical protein CHX27_09015 [Flavobacterium aurantiibacter]
MKKLLLLFFFLQTSVLSAQSKTDYSVVKWVNEDDGLSQLYTTACQVDNNGFVWIATQLGLFRYDWKRVVKVQIPEYPDIEKKRIQFLLSDLQTEQIYFYTVPDDVGYCINNGKIRRLKKSEGEFIDNFFYLPATHPMYRAVINYRKKHDFGDHFYINKRVVLTDDYFYMIFRDAVVILDKQGKTKSLPIKAGDNSTFIQYGKLIFFVDEEKIGLITGGEIEFGKVEADQTITNFFKVKRFFCKFNEVLKIEDDYYITYKKKIYKIVYRDGRLTAEFKVDSPLPDYEDNNFSYSSKHDLFLFPSYTRGMAIIKPKVFNTVFVKPNSFVSDYSVVSKDNYWYGQRGWIYDAKSNRIKREEFDSWNYNFRFLLKHQDNYFLELRSSLVSLLDFKTRFPIKLSDEFNRFTAFSYLDGKLWLSNEHKIARVEKNKPVFDSIFNKRLLPKQIINSIASFNHRLIIATSLGVFVHEPFSKNTYAIKGLEKKNVRYIKPIDKKRFWAGSYGDGLFLVDHGVAYHVVDKNIEINAAHAVEEDASGNLWISTNNGLIVANKKEVISKTLKKQLIEGYIFLTYNGLPTNEFNGGSTFPSLRENDIIGFPSMKGFVWFDSRKVKKIPFSGSILIDEVQANRNKIKPATDFSYSIPKDAEIIRIKYSYGYPGNSENLTISYKFEDQSTWMTVKENTIVLPRYKKGTHKLLIKIRTHGFPEKSDVVKSLTLHFEERFTESVWMVILVVCALFISIATTYLVVKKIQRKREEELNNKINLKTKQLQDTILELSESKEMIRESLLEKELLLKEVHHRVKNNLQLIMSIFNIQARRKNYSNIFDFLKTGGARIEAMSLIHQRLYQDDGAIHKINLEVYFKDLVDSINNSFNTDLDKIQIKIEPNTVVINLSTAIPLGLILNELITNALKYAFPDGRSGVIQIRVGSIGNSRYELIVEDNGVGFDTSRTHSKSFGIELITVLAGQLNGSMQYSSNSKTQFAVIFEEVH